MVQTHEAVAMDIEIIRDQLRYGKVRQLLRKLMPIGIRKVTLFTDKNKLGGHKTITIRFVPSNSKFINPYTFLGFFIKARVMATTTALIDPTVHQMAKIADTVADEAQIHVSWHLQFDERNPEFHMAKV